MGNTPLVRLNRVGKETGAKIVLKLEFFNPLSSVKDRIGVAMIDAAEKDGRIKPGTIIIEPTSGNTGIALAFVAAARGYRLILTMPETMSIERRTLLRAYGRGTCPHPRRRRNARRHPQSRRTVAAKPGAFMPQQFNNPANPAIHRTHDRRGNLERHRRQGGHPVAGVGTGGTISGIAETSKNENRPLRKSRWNRPARPSFPAANPAA